MHHKETMGLTAAIIKLGDKLLNTWRGLQVSYYGGKYSIERVLALEIFTSTAAAPTKLLSSIIPFLFTLAFVLSQELIPLQDPKDGWQRNHGFWIRVMIFVFAGTYSMAVHVSFFISGVTLSLWRKLVLSTCASISYAVCAMAISAWLGFPVPFFALLMSPVFNVVLFLSFKLVVSKDTLKQIMDHRDQLKQYLNFVSVQTLMAYLYPSYEALFRHVQGSHYQIVVILLLPVIKVTLKTIVLRCTAHLEDLTPESVIFTVDFFNAVYMSTCMQRASTITAIVVMIITDLIQTMFTLYGLHRRTATLPSRIREWVQVPNETKGLLNLVCAICRSPDKFQAHLRPGIQILSCLPQDLSPEDKDLLVRLTLLQETASQHVSRLLTFERTNLDAHSSYRSRSRPKLASGVCNWRNSVLPHPSSNAQEISEDETRPAERLIPCPSSSMLLQEALETLFTIECLMGTAFLEALIPLLYCGYIMLMLNFPSAKYHSEMTGITRENVTATVVPLFVFGLIQVLSLVILVIMIKRKCEINALYQLAFVLKVQMPLIQGKLAFWVMVTMCFRVAHFGIDFTFKFGRH